MNTVSSRIAVVTLAALAPLFLLTLVLALRYTPPASAVIPLLLAVGLLGLGVGVGVYTTHLTLVAPLSRMMAQVQRWRDGGAMQPQQQRGGLRELNALSHALVSATAALDDQKARLDAAVAQQELLMQEIHHRVKNNLQIVASLLNLQASRIRQPQARAEFQAARDRVRALATLHRHLYAHGEVHTINMREFLTELCGQLLQAMGEAEGGRIRFSVDAPEVQMSSDQAVPLSLIVTEAVSNAFKYAFPAGRQGTVSVRLVVVSGVAELTIQDDGVGIPAGRVETETGTRDGLGIQLIRGFARQLGAQLHVSEEHGTRYTITVPLARERVPSPALGGAAAAAAAA